ncbi:hypothetical protein WR25_20233 isoform B [Diploscapter pachys]|uniref:Uncharacterized protein n=1 Tax=Diploscapter pachys TaxID=2018661 RepID=A0A2A2KHP5_9BILA|nr:hypothetical protein WR25_20233 isoform B [Diploscapter pachys]
MPPLSVFSIAFLSLLAASRLEDSLPVSDSAANRVFDPTRNHTRHRFFNSTADVSDISDTIEGKADEANHRESEKRTPDGMRKSMTSDCGKPPEEREVWLVLNFMFHLYEMRKSKVALFEIF